MRLRIAVVGAGPAGLYAIHHLLEQDQFEVELDLIERLPTPWGLIRAGVAPDHPEKKQITDNLFDFYLKDPRVRFLGGVTVGEDIAHAELAGCYDAVIYAVGADGDRSLGVEGDRLPGSWSAREFVAWYNGHPDYRDLRFDLSHPTAVVVGTGNVALDVARMLTLPAARLARTDIADHALEALRDGQVREVVVLGRRGCRDAAFHNPELEELLHLDGVEVRIEADDLADPDPADCDWQTRRKLDTLRALQARRVVAPDRRIVFRFGHTPTAIRGPDRVTAVATRSHGDAIHHEIPCGLVLRAIGYRGRPVPGLPFDTQANVVSNVAGRVCDAFGMRPGVYVTGWIKRGPRGVIGSNKRCAADTVEGLLADAAGGRLPPRAGGTIDDILAARGRTPVGYRGWRMIDRAERHAGQTQDRPRVKQTAMDALLALAATNPRQAADANP